MCDGWKGKEASLDGAGGQVPTRYRGAPEMFSEACESSSCPLLLTVHASPLRILSFI